ncbi:hypothetical protein ACHAQJ_001959 [Trichoderma viride]
MTHKHSQFKLPANLVGAVTMSTNTNPPQNTSPPESENAAPPTSTAPPPPPERSTTTPDQPPPSSTAPPPPPTSSSPPPSSSPPSEAPPTSTPPSSTPPPTSSTPSPPPTSTTPPPTSTTPPPSSSSSPSSTSSTPESSSTTTTPEQTTTSPGSSTSPPSSTSSPPPTSSSSTTTTTPPSSSSTDTTVSVTGSDPATATVIVTHTTTPSDSPSGTSSTSTSTATLNGVAGKTSSGGLDQKAKVAIGVVVPIAAIAILAVIGLFFWKKTRARRQAEAERRKEVEDYAYNPNADPTIPTVGMTGGGDSYEMREEESVGYRGWGSTTLAGGSTGRKASTTISGATNNAYSDMSPSRGNMSDAALIDNPEGEILGAMGPAAANNRGDVRRGASNASSSYSATGRSDGSDAGVGVAYGGGGGGYYDQYGQNSYETGYGSPGGEMPAPPVIRDNPARRSTRVENPGHFPQQSAGISQNF